MSILFGVRQFAGNLVKPEELECLAKATERYAPDGVEMKVKGSVGMGVQPYYTHRRSRIGSMMEEDDLGNWVCLDGRLDNAKELGKALDLNYEEQSDAVIVLSAFRKYGEECFAHLIGDWAIVLWSSPTQTLYMARDHAGTRTLYYTITREKVIWGTYPEIFFCGDAINELDVEFVAGYLTSQATHLCTPYQKINVVPPAHFLEVSRDGHLNCRTHWNWMRGDACVAKSAKECEEEFVYHFARAVERRTEDNECPVVAELSGGMDSCSIVCMSDHLRRYHGRDIASLLDTVSYSDPQDPHWDELPYIRSVEQQRKKVGTHMHLPLFSSNLGAMEESYFSPGCNHATLENDRKFYGAFGARGYRVVISGLAGDELLGGVPVGVPELADYLARFECGKFVKRSMEWCLPNRIPLIHMAYASMRFLIAQYTPAVLNPSDIPGWSSPTLIGLAHDFHRRGNRFSKSSWLAPSRICNGRSWWSVLDTLPHNRPRNLSRMEYRYPFLDRELVEFLFRVPREWLLGPGRRRSMMRNAMSRYVPQQIIDRRRKGYRSKAILPALRKSGEPLYHLLLNGFCSRNGFVMSDMRKEIDHALTGTDMRSVRMLTRLVLFELWIASAMTQRRLSGQM